MIEQSRRYRANDPTALQLALQNAVELDPFDFVCVVCVTEGYYGRSPALYRTVGEPRALAGPVCAFHKDFIEIYSAYPHHPSP